jgi:hypothetical protein
MQLARWKYIEIFILYKIIINSLLRLFRLSLLSLLRLVFPWLGFKGFIVDCLFCFQVQYYFTGDFKDYLFSTLAFIVSDFFDFFVSFIIYFAIFDWD